MLTNYPIDRFIGKVFHADALQLTILDGDPATNKSCLVLNLSRNGIRLYHCPFQELEEIAAYR